ncbi:pyridoxal phosphate phosphatase PHOSPHO2-like [Ctenocephalides felis]|uniref:pyridoxal phosphate phosphatase PHOSPHO2-like n=1 Tax=Ctenocephalides felis TaxID=7515 RepID=UPI000E6E3388|nr:pyridoxal phosphate phosphatase PHOSPHO2-like [Ctenocephalides felis]
MDSDLQVISLIKDEIPSRLEQFLKDKNWHSYMCQIFAILQEKKIDRTEIYGAIADIPEIEGTTLLVKTLDKLGYDIIIISDSNHIFIENWLDAHKLDKFVKKIFTNPAFYDKSERLNVVPYQSQTECNLCPRNLCKGSILTEYIKISKKNGLVFDKVIYIGDGGNDFCPMLRLRKSDIACPKLGCEIFTVIDLFAYTRNPDVIIKAVIRPWLNAYDVLKVVQDLTRK